MKTCSVKLLYCTVLAVLLFAQLCNAAEAEVNASGDIDTSKLDKSASATLLTEAESDSAAPRVVFKEAIDMARLAFNDEDGLAVAGFFEADETGSVKNREEGSAYQVFRDSTTKNAKLPFGKSTSKDLARVFGVKKMNTMWLLKKNAIRGTTLEIRKCQFFDDLSIYISDDSNNIVGTWSEKDGFREWGPERALKHMKTGDVE